MALLDEELTGEAFITPRIKSAMATKAFWLTTVGILGVICFAIGMMLSFYLVYDSATSKYIRAYEIGASVVTVMLNMIGLYGFALLAQAGQSLRRYLRGNDIADLESAFDKQKVFWVIAGVTAVLFSLGFLLLVVMIILD